MFEIGAGKHEITPKTMGIGMMGWGMYGHIAEGVETPLFARTIAFREKGAPREKTFVLSLADVCFISQSIRQRVLEILASDHSDLGLDPEWICLTSTHTHSAQGGYSHYLLYNVTVPGYCEEVLESYARGIAKSIVSACRQMQPGNIRFGKASFPLSMPVAFNRSVSAWNQNPECPKLSRDRRAEAVSRDLWLFRFDSLDGSPIAVWNGFGVHATSVHIDNHRVSSDNKGYAMTLFEEKMPTGFVALFTQSGAGDVTPNYRRKSGIPFMVGRFRDDYRSARYNGALQMRVARWAYRQALKSEPLHGPLDSILRHFDLSNVEVDPKYSDGVPGRRTGKAALGFPFLLGTEEGPGAPPVAVKLFSWVEIVRSLAVHFYRKVFKGLKEPFQWDHPIHGKKIIFMETGERRLLGAPDIHNVIIPSWIDPCVRVFKDLAKNNAMGGQPFTPQVLPIQIFRLGNFAFLVLPSEFTTTSAKRLRENTLQGLRALGITQAFIQDYSNSYAGYVTTMQEYQVQRYEGASTHFGKWTLAAYQTLTDRLMKAFLLPVEQRAKALPEISPYRFSKEELSQRCFVKD